jgi:hypothetical protein
LGSLYHIFGRPSIATSFFEKAEEISESKDELTKFNYQLNYFEYLIQTGKFNDWY